MSSPTSQESLNEASKLNPPETSEEISTEALWDKIGFHKPLAGFTFNLIFAVISQLISVFIAGILVNIFYPYPESNGYRGVVSGIFALFYTAMDLGTNMIMERFIAEARIKNPKRMLQYIQFYIWYQAFTGLAQTTVVTLYALFIVPNTNLGYGMWLMLIVAVYQYPGFLGVFGSVLGSLQQYHRTAILGFISGEAFSRICELSFVFLGRMYGQAHPEIGEIMGIAIGANIGIYIKDFFSMWLSAYYFSKAMKTQGIKARDCFRVQFDRKLIKECITFGIKTGLPNLIGTAMGFIILMEYVTFMPQYTTFATLSGLIGGISNFVNWGSISAPTPLIAESYLNGKKKLTQYYATQTFRYITLFQFMFLPSILTIYMVLPKFFVVFDMEQYALAIPFFFPTLIGQIQQPYTNFADALQLGTNHPNSLMILRFTEESMKIFFVTLWVVILQLPLNMGQSAVIWILPCGVLPAILWKTIMGYIYVHKKIVPLKINAWQNLGAPLIAGGTIFAGLALFVTYAFPALEAVLTFIPTVFISIILLIILLLFGYLPFTAYLGGWDTESMRDFARAAQMSGPSRFFVMPMYKLTAKAAAKSRLHNRFRIPAEEAMKEARELLEIKIAHQKSKE